jgi:hypothetical protein
MQHPTSPILRCCKVCRLSIANENRGAKLGRQRLLRGAAVLAGGLEASEQPRAARCFCFHGPFSACFSVSKPDEAPAAAPIPFGKGVARASAPVGSWRVCGIRVSKGSGVRVETVCKAGRHRFADAGRIAGSCAAMITQTSGQHRAFVLSSPPKPQRSDVVVQAFPGRFS